MTESQLNEARLEAIRVAVAELRAEYAEVLPGLVSDLTVATERACASAVDAELDHARTLVHRIRGAAGSYGFKRVSERAAVIEDLLYERERAHAPFDAVLRDRVLAGLAELRATTAAELIELAPKPDDPGDVPG